jgi:hypothetical protein
MILMCLKRALLIFLSIGKISSSVSQTNPKLIPN